MSRRKKTASNGATLELWRPPPEAGDPIGCLATTYTFAPGLFDEQCLARFLEVDSDPDREDLAFRLERESRLGSIYAGVLVDHTQAGVEHSLRWDVLPVRIRAGKQHAKLSLLTWSNHIRIIVASANLTEAGYRINQEVGATIELSQKDADRDLLMQIIEFLRDLLAFVPGPQEKTEEVIRAENYLEQVERRTETWTLTRRRDKVHQHFVFTLPKVRADQTPRSSLYDAIAACRRRGGSPYEAWVASPFFDIEDDSSPVTVALCKSMARRRVRKLCFCVPTAPGDDETTITRLLAPKSILSMPPKYNGQVTIEMLPDYDNEKNHRPWHAKMLALRGDRYTALLIGSSNFTCAGMGIGSICNAEANLMIVVDRVAYGRDAGQLESIWPQMESVVDLDSVEWLNSNPEHNEEQEVRLQAVPAGFLSAVYRAGNDRQIVLHLDPIRLPSDWRVRACGQDERELLTRSQWINTGSLESVSLTWLPIYPPDRILISWEGSEAFLPINVENRQELPPPAQLKQMSADQMLWILASTDASAAFRVWAQDQQQESDLFDPELDSATPFDLDPLRRHDLQTTFLHRIRRRARILAQLRANLQRPVWGRQALEWRLRGIIGIEALGKCLVRELEAEPSMADESLLSLADFLIVLNEVNYQPTVGCLTRSEFEAVFQPFLCELVDKLQKEVSVRGINVSHDLMAFWQRVLDQCL